MKEVYKSDDVIVYDGFKDAFGGKIFVVINATMHELRLYGKYKDFKKRRKSLDSAKLKYVWTPEYGEVIDITESTKRKIEKLFLGYSHTEWQIADNML